MCAVTSDLHQRSRKSRCAEGGRALPILALSLALVAFPSSVAVAEAEAAAAVATALTDAAPKGHEGRRQATRAEDSPRHHGSGERGAGAKGGELVAAQPKRLGVDLEAMAEASAPDRHPCRVASSHAYEAFLMALRARDAGDLSAARHWFRQVLAFDAGAGEARRALEELGAEASRGR